MESRMEGEAPTWTIGPHRPSFLHQIPDIWLRRRLLGFFMRRAIMDLYAQTILGVAWVFIRPLIMVIGATLVVGGVLGVSTRPVPILLFTLTSFSGWMVFERGLVYGTKSIIRNRNILKQFYFPRVIMHVATIGPALVEGGVVLICALVATGYFAFIAGTWELHIGWYSLLVIPSVVLLLLLMLGLSMVTSVLNSYARDTQYSIRYASSALLLATPVFYPVAAVPEKWHIVMWLNPLTPTLEMFRWAMFHVHEPRWEFVALAAGTTLLTFVFGLWVFIKWEASALDAR
jgi:homopolymeric O-antigen transport system permease protein